MRRGVATGPLVLALLAPAAASGRALPRLQFPLPSAGHATLVALRIDVKARKPAKLPTRLHLRFAGASRLPPSVRTLSFTRSLRTRRGRAYFAVLVAVRRAGASARAAS